MEGESVLGAQGMCPGATGGWGLRMCHGHTMAAAGPGSPSWSSGVGTGLGEMLLQANQRAHSGRKTLSGRRKGSENLPRGPASAALTKLSVNALSLPVSQLALE